MTARSRTWQTLALGALLILPLFGCGDDDNDGDSPAAPEQPDLTTILIADRDYEKNRFFNVTGEGGRRTYRAIDSLEVFVADDNPYNDNETGALDARAHLDGDPTRPASVGRFEQLVEGYEYVVNRTTGTLYMRNRVSEPQLAVYYVLSGDEPIEQRRVGFRPANPAPAGTDTTILKLIQSRFSSPGVPEAEDPSDGNTILRETWPLQLRNFYDLHFSDIFPEDFSVRIIKRSDDAEDIDVQAPDGTTFLRVLGLDNHGVTAGSPPDDQIDPCYDNCNNNLPLTDDFCLVDYVNGFLIFPGEQPFDPVPGQEKVACDSDVTLTDRNPIYNKPYGDLWRIDAKYVIEVMFNTVVDYSER